jgi:hypothetical protein
MSGLPFAVQEEKRYQHWKEHTSQHIYAYSEIIKHCVKSTENRVLYSSSQRSNVRSNMRTG